jgi:hypothetical protein
MQTETCTHSASGADQYKLSCVTAAINDFSENDGSGSRCIGISNGDVVVKNSSRLLECVRIVRAAKGVVVLGEVMPELMTAIT